MSMVTGTTYKLSFHEAAERLKDVVKHTSLSYNPALSKKYKCNIFLKREDLQIVRSYKLRGAYNMMSSLTAEDLAKGVVCASAGNHAQGFAYSCRKLNIQGVVFMPITTPKQKINQTEMFGEGFIEIRLVGDTFDDCANAAKHFSDINGMTFIPPFDDVRIIEGQGTVAVEILADQPQVDYLFVPVGGGGLSAGIGSYFKTYSPKTKIIGLEPEGAPSMSEALKAGQPISLNAIESFVDGAAVKCVGNITFSICKDVLDEMQLVPEGKICTTILQLYNEEAIVVEPAGALSIAALDFFKNEIVGKNVVCIVSGSNNDITRTEEIKERSLLYEGLKHYFLINFSQRPGALKEFVNDVLGKDDDITYFQYNKKNNREEGPAVVGIELKRKTDLECILQRLKEKKIRHQHLNEQRELFTHLVF